ncbi:hypothetical protein [Selenomonas sp.]|uniref:hypothetical protein n=1 Tax=Selenomonas sp. TaxID=2053611 RepID=UPI0025D421AC|nr:hypothetical protein [Selenomonas sp.]MBQ1867368.1 hypothetical protein [Selenomonas sp.]
MVNTLGSLIIIGFVLVMGARWLSKRQQGTSWDEEELVDSANQLKAEIERSADAVIKRMGSHINHLEQLLQQAEARNRELEAQLLEARQLSMSLEQQGRQLDERIMTAKQTSQELAIRWQNPPVMPMMAPNAMAPAMSVQQPVMQQPAATVERVDAQDFAAVLQKSIEREEQEIHAPHITGEHQAAGLAEAMNNRAAEVSEEPADKPAGPVEEEPSEGMSQSAAKARALLLSGYSVEETARETGIGKGAIELLREMNRHELE